MKYGERYQNKGVCWPSEKAKQCQDPIFRPEALNLRYKSIHWWSDANYLSFLFFWCGASVSVSLTPYSTSIIEVTGQSETPNPGLQICTKHPLQVVEHAVQEVSLSEQQIIEFSNFRNQLFFRNQPRISYAGPGRRACDRAPDGTLCN